MTKGGWVSAPELILMGRMVTMAGEPDARADALAIADGRVQAVGTRDEVLSLAEEATQVVDLGARAVLPGFGDSHVHLALTGLGLIGAQVASARSHDDLLLRLRDFADKTDPDEPIWGHGLNVANLAERRPPARWVLDRVSSQRPVVVVDRSHHALYANTPGLVMLLSHATAEERQGASQDGLIVGRANTYAKRHFARLVHDDTWREAIQMGARHAAERGVTLVHAFEGGWAGPPYGALVLEEAQRLPVRVALYEQGAAPEAVVARGGRSVVRETWLDGGVFQHTAAFADNYRDVQATGLLYQTDEQLAAWVLDAHRAGLQVALQAVGDRAVEQALDAVAAALRTEPRPDARHRIEHFTYATRGQHERAAELGVVLSLQPNVPLLWQPDEAATTRVVGMERARRKVHARWALDAGAVVAGGSESDTRPIQPIAALNLLVNDPREGRALSLHEALRTITGAPAYAAFQEHESGTLEVGKRADLVVLDRDPLDEPARLRERKVEATLLGGHVVAGELPAGVYVATSA